MQIPPRRDLDRLVRIAYGYLEMPPTTRPRPESTSARAPGEKLPLAERREQQLATNNPHVDIAELTTSDGLYAVISQRKANGVFTFAIFKSFDRDGHGPERTSFIPEELGESYIKLARLVLERIDAIRADGTAPFKERLRA